MSLMKALKYIDDNFSTLQSSGHLHEKINGQKMSVYFDISNDMLRLEWIVGGDKFDILIELYGTESFTYNTWNSSMHTWNEDFEIYYDIERSYFDCLVTVYPMSTNFKYEHIKVLKSIAQKYAESKNM